VENGPIDGALLGIIRRWHLHDQVSLREITRRFGVSRNTVRRYLRADSIEPTYASRRSSTSLDTYAVKLSTWLKTEAAKSRKQKKVVEKDARRSVRTGLWRVLRSRRCLC